MWFSWSVQILTMLLVAVCVSSDSCCKENSPKNCTDLDFENCENKCCNNETEERIIVCFFTNWAWYRSGIAKYMPDNINASLCTHINYAFASLDNDTLTIESSDSWADIDNKFFEEVVALIAKGLKVLLSIGGWNDSTTKWRRMFNNSTARAIFVKSTLEFIKYYNFSGLDVDYEYPGCPQGDSSYTGDSDDAENFNQLIRELKAAFDDKYLLTVSVAAGKNLIEKCYNMSELCCIPDWINVMTYDYHSSTEGVVGANAPICGTESSWGVYESFKYLINVAKCPAKKLTMGFPFYGQSFTLANSSNHGFGDEVSGAGTAGTYTQSSGTLAYFEICLNQKDGWETGWSKTNGSYAWNDTQLVTFDSVKDIKRKCCLINKHFGLLGAMFWTLDYDDFTDSCGCGIYPLLTTLNQQLRCLNVSCTECY